MSVIWPPIPKIIRKNQIIGDSNLNHTIYASKINPNINDTEIRSSIKKNEITAFIILTRFTERNIFEFDFERDGKKITIKEFPDVISSVEKINKYYPNNQIIVIDSGSSDKSYQKKIREIDPSIIIEDINNKNYESGGIVYAFKKYKKYFAAFFFLQDSILIGDSIIEEVFNPNKNSWYALQFTSCGWCHRSDFNEKTKRWELDEKSDFIIRDACVFKYGLYQPIHIGPNIARSIDKDIISSYKEPFHIAYSNSFLINSEDFEKVLHTNIINICPLPVDKIGSCTWERVWALAFKQANLKEKFFLGSEIIHWFGNCAGGKGANHTKKFTKFYLGRK